MFEWLGKLKKEATIVHESNRICPNCIEKMNKVVKSDIIIDVCPKCSGIWLDANEIDKLMEYEKAQAKSEKK